MTTIDSRLLEMVATEDHSHNTSENKKTQGVPSLRKLQQALRALHELRNQFDRIALLFLRIHYIEK